MQAHTGLMVIEKPNKRIIIQGEPIEQDQFVCLTALITSKVNSEKDMHTVEEFDAPQKHVGE